MMFLLRTGHRFRRPVQRAEGVLRGARLLLAWVFLSALPVAAGNGHFLHGVGAVNSSLGGAGVAFAADGLGAINLNPALLTAFEGSRVDFGVEFLTQDLSVESSVGPFSGSTNDDTDLAALPAFAWIWHPKGSRLAFGFGFLALAGFQTDYPQDSTNPVLLPQPLGFGRTLADYQFARIPLALAYQATDKLSVGASFSLGRAALDSSPFAGASPDCTSPVSCFYPAATPQDSALGFAVQVGLFFEPSEKLSFGVSYTTAHDFESFKWNSTVAHPDLPNFGENRSFEFTLDAPQRLTLGLGFAPAKDWNLALDVTWINYSDTEGFSGGNLDPRTGAIDGLGWEDIVVIAGGVEHRRPGGLALRGGFNISESAVPEDLAFFNIQAPAIQENHLTVGLGIPTGPVEVNLAYYHVFKADISGPFLSPAGPVPGSRVTSEISIDSLLLSLSFTR